MSESFAEIEGLSVYVDRVIHMPELDAPKDKPYPFAYFITVKNHSTERLVILRRKWVVREQEGEITVVEGDGVVGQTPELGPRESFSYNSYHVIAHEAVASGAFFGETASGKKFVVPIPSFVLKLPLSES